jgi:hypothetical protein
MLLLTATAAYGQDAADYQLNRLRPQVFDFRQEQSNSERATVTPASAVSQPLSSFVSSSSSSADPCSTCQPCDGWVASQCCGDGWLHTWDKCKWIKVGAGLRTSYNRIEGGAPNGSDWSNNFNLDNMRIYLSGQGRENIGFELNTDIRNAQFPEFGGTVGGETGGEVRILDAVVKFKLNDSVNLWAGRFLPPSDRSNLSGPFFLNAWSFPYAQFGYQNIFQGREDGVALWGNLAEDRVKWQFGVFEGRDSKFGAGSPSPSPVGAGTGEDDPMFSARVVVNLLDPEPGYYNSSTYYGEKDILALGASIMHQRNAVGAATDARNSTNWNIDVLFERKLDNCGVITVEAAYYNFDDGDAESVDPAGIFTPLGRQGDSHFVLVSYLIPGSVGIGNLDGRFQPYVRYLDYHHDFGTAAAGAFVFDDGIDIGLNYIIDGHNARLTAVWEQRELGAANRTIDAFRIGAQVQF